MDWAAIAVLCLAAWVWLQSRRLASVTRELDALRARLAAITAPPLLLEMPLRQGEDEPLLLDTPIPVASNDSDAGAPTMARAQPTEPTSSPRSNAMAQVFGALTMLAAVASPSLGAELRPPAATTLFICLIAAAGFLLATSKQSASLALATFVGLFMWFMTAINAGDVSRALATASGAALGGVSLAFRRAEAGEFGLLTWSRLRADGPSIAIGVSSVLTIWCWLAVAELQDAGVARLAWVGAALVALAAACIRNRIAAPASFAVATVSLVAGFVFFIGIRFQFPPLGDDFFAAALTCAVVLALAALCATPHRRSRGLVASSGAFGAAVLVTLAATTRETWHSAEAWGPLFAGAGALLACAPRRDAANVWPWVAAATALLILGVESASPELWRSASHAATAAVLALVFVLWRWRAAHTAALVVGTLALVYALRALDVSPSTDAFAATALAAALLFAADRIAGETSMTRQLQNGLSILSAVAAALAVLLALRSVGVVVSVEIVMLVLTLISLGLFTWMRREAIFSPPTISG